MPTELTIIHAHSDSAAFSQQLLQIMAASVKYIINPYGYQERFHCKCSCANVAIRANFTTDNTIDEYWEMAAQPLCIGSWIDACSKWHTLVFLEGFICVWLVDWVLRDEQDARRFNG